MLLYRSGALMRLIFGDDSPERVSVLKKSFSGVPGLSAVLVQKTNVLLHTKDLDAIYLSVVGAERWGARPLFHEAEVLKTKDEDRKAGWPEYVVAGVAMRKEDPRDPKFELMLIVRCVIEAIQTFNSHESTKIRTIAFGSDWIGLKKLDPAEAGDLIRRVCEEHGVNGESDGN